jgi:hypothetical protein
MPHSCGQVVRTLGSVEGTNACVLTTALLGWSTDVTLSPFIELHPVKITAAAATARPETTFVFFIHGNIEAKEEFSMGTPHVCRMRKTRDTPSENSVRQIGKHLKSADSAFATVEFTTALREVKINPTINLCQYTSFHVRSAASFLTFFRSGSSLTACPRAPGAATKKW